MFDRILLVLDDPADADRMIAAIRPIVRARRAHVSILHAIPFLETVAEMPHEATEFFVDALVESLKAEGLSADGFTDIGGSALMIAAAAERVEASLIVLPIRPSRRTEALVRLTRVPVYAVPRGAPLLDRILIPIDATERSLEVLPYAAVLARACKARITFVEVGPSHWESLKQTALERASGEGVEGQIVAGLGDPAAALLQLCRSLPAGAIAMASAEPPWVARLVRVSPVPVLVARRRPESRLAVESLEHWSIPLTVPVWKHRVPSNPFEGISEP